MKKYGKFAVLVVVIVGTLIWLATAGMKDTQTYYKTIAELNHMGDQAYVKRLRVGGDVGAGSINRKGNVVEFILVQEKLNLKVAYDGSEPLRPCLQGLAFLVGRVLPDVLGPGHRLLVRHQAERGDLAGPVALLAAGLEDRQHVAVEGHFPVGGGRPVTPPTYPSKAVS